MPPPVRSDPRRLSAARFRTVPAHTIEEMLLLGGALAGATGAEARAAVARLGAGAALHDPAEMLDRLVAAGLAGSEPFWAERYVATGRAMATMLGGGPDPRALPSRRFDIAMTRLFFPPTRAGGARLRLPLPITGPHLTALTVDLACAAGAPTIGRDRIELALADFAAPVALTARFGFTAYPGLPHRAVEPPEAWFAPREGAIQLTDAVRALAADAAGDTADPAEIVLRLRDRLIDGFACGAINPAWIDDRPAVDWAIAHRWYDCRIGGALLAALCRARGVPARLIGGYLLWDAPMEHYWIEAWLPGAGWTPFDLLAWDISAGGRDPAWRSTFAGAIDYRMTTQIFPDRFVGPPGVAMAGGWHRLPRRIPGGTETRYIALDGRPLFTETVRHLPAGA